MFIDTLKSLSMKLLNIKSIIVVALIFYSTFSVVAQNEKETKFKDLMPKEGDFGVSLIITGLIDNINLESFSNDYGQNILFAKYYLKDDLALRTGFGLSINRFKREQADSSGLNLIERDSLISSARMNVSIGIEKHLSTSNRLDPYIFAQIDLTFIGKTTTESETRNISQVGTSSVVREIREDGGIAFGFQAGGGFNYFIAPRFSVGTELALRLLAVSQGGTTSDNTTNTSINGNITTNFMSSENKVNNTNLNVQPVALLNLSYFF